MEEPSVADAKQSMRADVLAARRGRSPAAIDAARALIRAVVLERAHAEPGWQCVAAYRPLRTEPGSVELLDALAALGRRVLIPLTLDDRDLDWLEWDVPAEPLGVSALAAADVVFVPALATSWTGVRLGRGGGSYDRALRRVRPDAGVVALLYDEEVVESVPGAAWDIPVDAVVTPLGWRQLRHGPSIRGSGSAGNATLPQNG